ncbi:pseudouridine synthase [Adlercreutzia sp. ZJ242]|uniref:pseudouridine synthase n=1 Tax=Adlercreutzia sp. ZJ242 TaxID=2709409 RepID=UPI0013EADC61|nr:pseudouridine synthase [Adlercreutzia sp. ZJ242]
MRLQKFLARAGVASRRGSEELISAGRVRVNGACVTELGSKVDADSDVVEVDGARVELPRESVTLMLHKPAGYVTTMSDPQGRPTVAELVPAGEGRFAGLYPVGRLDADTTGLLLFSTDGELGNALLHPRRHVTKRYVALVEGSPDARDVERLRRGVRLSDGMTLPAEVRVLEGKAAKRAAALIGEGRASSGNARRHTGRRSRAALEHAGACSYVEVGLREGRKRQVRRMLEAVGCPVVALHRATFGPLELGDLPRGQWRELAGEEVAALREAARE